MRMIYATRSVLGVFAFDDKGKLVKFIPFEGNAQEVAHRLNSIDRIPEEDTLQEEFGDVNFEFENFPNLAGETLRRNLREILHSIGLEYSDYLEKLREVSFHISRERARQVFGERDRMLIEAIKALDDLNEVLNMLSERLRSWYSLHYPELSSRIEEHREFAELIAKYGSRESFPEQEQSLGVELGDREREILRSYAQELVKLYDLREELEEFIEKEAREVAPNLTYLVGAGITARLIALANGLRNLALMPGSRIQILGAEKALFRHLRLGKKPPKHGIIYQLPVIKGSPKKLRGKIARSLAAILAIAARVDAFSGEFVGEELKQKFEKRLQEIKGAKND